MAEVTKLSSLQRRARSHAELTGKQSRFLMVPRKCRGRRSQASEK